MAANNLIHKSKEERSYKNYDVTDDKIKDTVKVTVTENRKHESDHSETMRIHINNSVLFDISNLVDSDDVGLHELFQLKNGKLKSIYDLQTNTSMDYARNHSID